MSAPLKPVRDPFLRFANATDWNAGRYAQTSYDEAAGGVRLGDAAATPIAPTEPAGTFGGLTQPTGLAIGPHGRLFLADPDRNRVLTYTTHEKAFVPLWAPRASEPPDAYTLLSPRGIAISPDSDLVIADTGHGRVIFYTWPGLAARHILAMPGGEPWDLAYDAEGRLYVADATAGRVWRYDRLWRLDDDYSGGRPVLIEPRHLAVDATGSVLVLDSSLQAVIELDLQGRAVAAQGARPVIGVTGALPSPEPRLFRRELPLPLRWDGTSLWLPQEERPRCPELELAGLEVDRLGRVPGLGLALLALPMSVRYPRAGSYITPALDSGSVGCAWHRLTLDCAIPTATSVVVRTYTTAADIGLERVADLPPDRWSTPLVITSDDRPEVLVQSPPGRYLWMQFQLSSNGSATPLLRALTVYAPRQSSLHYLPPVFREDPVSADFLDRYLSYFNTVFDEIESQIERFTGYLNPDGAPSGDFLAWLASWVDIAFLAEWPDATRREFVRRAIALHKQRGTIAGLQAVLRLHSGLAAPYPVIVEHFRLRSALARREMGAEDLVNNQLYLAGIPLAPQATEIAHHFTIVVPSRAAPDAAAEETLRRVIDQQKPAHTRYQLRIVAPGLRIGCQSTIGVDTLLGPYPTAALSEMTLAQSSQLAAPEPRNPRLGRNRLVSKTCNCAS